MVSPGKAVLFGLCPTTVPLFGETILLELSSGQVSAPPPTPGGSTDTTGDPAATEAALATRSALGPCDQALEAVLAGDRRPELRARDRW